MLVLVTLSWPALPILTHFIHSQELTKSSFMFPSISICNTKQYQFPINQLISLSLSQRFPFFLSICEGYFFTPVTNFLFHLFIIFFLVGLPAYVSNHIMILRENIIVGFNEFPSLKSWCTVIHHHQPTLFWRVRWDCTVSVQRNVCTDTGPPICRVPVDSLALDARRCAVGQALFNVLFHCCVFCVKWEDNYSPCFFICYIHVKKQLIWELYVYDSQ